MLVVAFWSPKGGVGKTTLALNVAGDLTHRKYKVVLFDADPQGSACAVARFGNLNFKVVGGPPDRKKLDNDVDFVIIDYPPRYEALPAAKRVVVPLNPSYVDVAATSPALKQLKKRKILQVPNNISKNLESRDLIQYLEGSQPKVPAVRRRTVYTRLMNEGRTVFQKRLSTWPAREEIRKLTDAIFE